MLKKGKKILAILLAVLMMANTAALFASAEGDDASPDFMYGDVTLNGKVNFVDAGFLWLANLGFIHLTDTQKLAADVNGDGKVDKADRKLVGQFSRKAIAFFPVEQTIWPEGTPVETTYDENGTPQVLLFRQYRDTPIEDLKATIAGSTAVISNDGEASIALDYELGIFQTDIYLKLTVRQMAIAKFRTQILQFKLLEKDFRYYIIQPTLGVYIDLFNEAGIPEEEQETWLSPEIISTIKSWINDYLFGALVGDTIAQFYTGTSLVEVGGAKFLCESYGQFRVFYTEDGVMRRVEMTVGDSSSYVITIRSSKADVKMSQFNIPVTYREVTFEDLQKLMARFA